MLKGQNVSFPVVIRVEKINVDTPVELASSSLMLLVVGITRDPDAIIRDLVAILNSSGTLAPLEVENIVCNVVPVLAEILSVVKFFVDAARFILKFRASRPRGGEGPRALRGVEEVLLDAFT